MTPMTQSIDPKDGLAKYNSRPSTSLRVRNGKIAEHWGVANLFSLMQQLGAWPAKQDRS
jgi:hypothetical protein